MLLENQSLNLLMRLMKKQHKLNLPYWMKIQYGFLIWRGVSNEEIKKLTEKYLEYLQLDRIALDKRIVEYKISEVKMTTIYGGDITFCKDC